MPEPLIQAENLCKIYTLTQSRSRSLKETAIRHWLRAPARQTIQALQNVSFSVAEGMALGIIGSNGSGKSTLLKIISGITEPTSGRVTVRGRVASLLELGAGFHPELTGMENIFMNASVLGLPGKKVAGLLDEIIGFAELEDFIYMPVKHYSSGMLMRLGFAVAVHVDPDILVLDEVMAVGDAWFQERSSQCIRDFRRRGKTILLVTHNLDQAEVMSDAVLWLENGQVKMHGAMAEAINAYIREFYDHKLKEPPIPFTMDFGTVCRSARLGSGEVLIRRIVFTDGQGREIRAAVAGGEMHIEIHYEADREGRDLEAVMGIGRMDDVGVTRVDSTSHAHLFRGCPKTGVITAIFSPLIINGGGHRLSVALNPPGKPYEPYDMHMRFYDFKIISRDDNPTGTVVTHPARFELSPGV